MNPDYFRQSNDLPLLLQIARNPNWKPTVPMSRAQARPLPTTSHSLRHHSLSSPFTSGASLRAVSFTPPPSPRRSRTRCLYRITTSDWSSAVLDRHIGQLRLHRTRF